MLNYSLKYARKAAYLNQSELVEYLYISSVFHRNFKEKFSLNKDNPAEDEKKEVRRALVALIRYLDVNLQKISEKNIEILSEYFSKRKLPHTDISLSVFVENEIIEIVRKSGNNVIYNSKIKENTAFSYVKKNGIFFICNNIPDKIKKKRYKDPNLESENYPYNSFLTIPLTLRNSDLSTVYKKLNRIKNIERTIFGFLSFKHPDINFFNEHDDIDIGYIFADFLSLYIITRLNFTVYSKTFNDAIDIIKFKDNSLLSPKPY